MQTYIQFLYYNRLYYTVSVGEQLVFKLFPSLEKASRESRLPIVPMIASSTVSSKGYSRHFGQGGWSSELYSIVPYYAPLCPSLLYPTRTVLYYTTMCHHNVL